MKKKDFSISTQKFDHKFELLKMNLLHCDEKLPLVDSPIVRSVAVADLCAIDTVEDSFLQSRKRARGAEAREFDTSAAGAQTPPPQTKVALAQHNNCTPTALDEASDDDEWPVRFGRRDKWTCAQTGISTLCSALAVTAADRSPLASPKWHWSGWWSLSGRQARSESLQMYAQVAASLRDTLLISRDAASAAVDCARRARVTSRSVKDRATHALDIKRFALQVEALSDGLIGLYVTQALEWTLAVQQASICVARNASLVDEELSGQTLALACAALALVCKSFHSDMDVDVDPERCVLARTAHCSVGTLDEIERLLLRAIDYRVHSMGDCFTILAYHSDTLPLSAATIRELRHDSCALERLGERLYQMMTGEIESFALLSPWARLSFACIEHARAGDKICSVATRRATEHDSVSSDAILRVAPTAKDAQSLCVFLNLEQ